MSEAHRLHYKSFTSCFMPISPFGFITKCVQIFTTSGTFMAISCSARQSQLHSQEHTQIMISNDLFNDGVIYLSHLKPKTMS